MSQTFAGSDPKTVLIARQGGGASLAQVQAAVESEVAEAVVPAATSAVSAALPAAIAASLAPTGDTTSTTKAATPANAASQVAAGLAKANIARALLSGQITALTWSGAPFVPASTPTVTLSAGYYWTENNSGAPKRSIAAVAATALAAGEGIIVDFVGGSTDGGGAYIPTKVVLAAGGASGWQSADKHVLVGRDANGALFGPYAANSPDLKGAAATALAARLLIGGQITGLTWSGLTPTVTLGAVGYAWTENNSGAPWRSIAPVAATTLAAGEGLIVDFDAGAVDGSGRYIPTKGNIASSLNAGWQGSKNKFVLVAVDATGNLFGRYALPPVNPNVGIYDAEVSFATTTGVLPTWNAPTRTLAWPEMVLICKKPSYGGRIKLQAGSVVFPAGNYHVATLDLSAVNNTLTPNTAVSVNSYVSGGWAGDDSTRIPLFAVSGDAAYPVRFPPVQGSLVGPGAAGVVSDYDPSEVVVVQTATTATIYKKGSNPASNRYLRFRMQRVTTPAINSDVWRWNEVWECERTGEYTFTDILQLANSGENEMAIRQNGKPDFMGGVAHGDEELFAVTMMIDGVVKPLGVTANFRCRRVEFVQGSDMYEEGTAKANRVAKSYKRWQFEAVDIHIWNNVVWEQVITLAQCYMTMLTWLRLNGAVQISDKGYRSPLYLEEDISVAGFTEVGSTAAIAKASGPTGRSAEVEILEGWDKPNRRFNFSPGAEYNKFYFEFCGAGYVTAIGEVMKSHARYRLDTIN